MPDNWRGARRTPGSGRAEYLNSELERLAEAVLLASDPVVPLAEHGTGAD
jgi:hypothetical protein